MGYDMYYRDRTGRDGEGYFRFNIWGMSWCADVMARRGMIFDAGQHPAWPEMPEDFDPYARKYPEDYDEKLTKEQEARADEWWAANDAVLSWHGPEVPGIPAHKFWSNDGWIVTPAECEAAARIAGGYVPEGDRADRWREWVAFIGRAAKHGGFEVH